MLSIGFNNERKKNFTSTDNQTLIKAERHPDTELYSCLFNV